MDRVVERGEGCAAVITPPRPSVRGEMQDDAGRCGAPARAGLYEGDRMDPSSCLLRGPLRRRVR
jgi:hypothetical protein